MSKTKLTSQQRRAMAQAKAKLAAEKAAGKKPTPKKKTSKKATPKKKTSKKPTPKKATTPKKRKASPRQLAALKKARAARKRIAAAAPATVARATRAKPVKKAARKAPKKVRKAPAAPAKKRAKKVSTGSYVSAKTGQKIIIRRGSYGRANPVVEFTQIAAAGGGLVLGLAIAELVDRYVATRAPKDAKDALSGGAATAAIRANADSTRMLVQGAGTVVFGAGAYALRNVAPHLAYGLGGTGAAFAIKLVTQAIGDHLMPWLFKVDSTEKDWDKSLAYRLYPDKQVTSPSGDVPLSRRGYMGGWRSPYGQMGAPAGRPPVPQGHYPFPGAPAPRADVGPVATGAVGCGGGGGCGAMRAVYGSAMSQVFPNPGQSSCSCSRTPPQQGPCSSCGSAPTPVPPPGTGTIPVTGNGNGNGNGNGGGVIPLPEQPDSPDRGGFMTPLPDLSTQPDPLRAQLRLAENEAARQMGIRGAMGAPDEPAPPAPQPPVSGPAMLMNLMKVGAAAKPRKRR